VGDVSTRASWRLPRLLAQNLQSRFCRCITFGRRDLHPVSRRHRMPPPSPAGILPAGSSLNIGRPAVNNTSMRATNIPPDRPCPDRLQPRASDVSNHPNLGQTRLSALKSGPDEVFKTAASRGVETGSAIRRLNGVGSFEALGLTTEIHFASGHQSAKLAAQLRSTLSSSPPAAWNGSLLRATAGPKKRRIVNTSWPAETKTSERAGAEIPHKGPI